ncbi:hypothetical protein TNCV_3436121 [Trichonephila clavipes]|nr:hypothetical protein TNCV_3436121 [Trichonephila clavipes]
MDEFRVVVWNAVLDFHGSISPAAEKIDTIPYGFNASCSHVTSPESRIGVVWKKTGVCSNSSMMFAESMVCQLGGHYRGYH